MLLRALRRSAPRISSAARTLPRCRALHASHSLRNDLNGRVAGSGLTNILAGDIPPPVQVKSISPSGIQLQDGLLIPGACIFLEGKVFLWDVPPTLWQGWDKERFEIFEVSVPKPGEDSSAWDRQVYGAPPAALRQYLNGLGIQLDVMDTWNACTTYNLLAEEGRRVAAALLPYNHHPWEKS